MENLPSPLDTLRQLKEMLDAGALTPAEFEALKQRLVFGEGTSAPAASVATPAPEPTAPEPVPPIVPPPALVVEAHSPIFKDRVASETLFGVPPVASNASEAEAPGASADYGLPSAGTPVSPAVVPPPEPALTYVEPVSGCVADEFPEAPAPPARNPLALVLSIGGLLALLALVLYLSLSRQPSEHISSLSQTAADSVAAPIETGPQAERLPARTAVSETVRLAPAHPAPALPTCPVAPVRDSATAAPLAPAPDSAVSR